MDDFEFETHQAMLQAEKIEDLSMALQTISDKDLQTVLDALHASWSGDASRRFLRYCQEIKENLFEQAESLRALARDIRMTAPKQG